MAQRDAFKELRLRYEDDGNDKSIEDEGGYPVKNKLPLNRKARQPPDTPANAGAFGKLRQLRDQEDGAGGARSSVDTHLGYDMEEDAFRRLRQVRSQEDGDGGARSSVDTHVGYDMEEDAFRRLRQIRSEEDGDVDGAGYLEDGEGYPEDDDRGYEDQGYFLEGADDVVYEGSNYSPSNGGNDLEILSPPDRGRDSNDEEGTEVAGFSSVLEGEAVADSNAEAARHFSRHALFDGRESVLASHEIEAHELAHRNSDERSSKGSQRSSKGSIRRSRASSAMSGISFTSKRQRSEESSQAITIQVVSESAQLRNEAQGLGKKHVALEDTLNEKTFALGQDVHLKLKKRIETTERLVSDLGARLISVEPVSYLLQQCIINLDHAHRNFWPCLSVAKQRQDIRSSCPTGELDKDYLQMALKYEQKMVAKGRRKIIAQKEEGKALLETLRTSIDDMRTALQRKRFHVAHDKQIMKVSQDKDKKGISTDLLKENKMTEGDRHAWHREVQDLLASTAQFEKSANAYRTVSEALIQDTAKCVQEAAKNTQDMFEKHRSEMNRLKRVVEQEMHKSHDTKASIEVIVADTKREMEKIRKPVADVVRGLRRTNNYSSQTKRTTLLSAVQAKHERLDVRLTELQEQNTWATRLLFDLRNSHEALEEDHHVKTLSMKYTEKCLLVTPMPDENPKTAAARQQLARRARETGATFATLRPATLLELRRRIRALASMGPGDELDLDSLFETISKRSGDRQDLTDHDVQVAMRKVFKISTDVISDAQICTLCAMLDEDDSGGVDVHELRDFIEREPVVKTVDSFDIRKVEKAKEKRTEGEVQERPPLEVLPILKKSQIVNLKKRIRGAAWIAANDQGISASTPAEQLASLFSQYDKDGGGSLEDLEVRKALRKGLKIPKAQLSDAELWTLIHLIDDDGSGCIDVQEFVAWVHSE